MSGPNVITIAQSPSGVSTITHSDSDTAVVLAPGPVTDVQVVLGGIPGPAGPTGPQGLPGAPGGSPQVIPVVAISSWSYTHSYPYPPEVRFIDADGEEVEYGVEYPDATHIAVEFPLPFTGTIIVS